MLKFSSNNASETQDIVSAVFCAHEMKPASSRINYRQKVFHLGALSLSTISYGGSVELIPEPFPDFYLIQLPLAGYDQQNSGKHEVVSDVCTATLHLPSEQVNMNWSSHCKKFVVRIEREALENQAAYVLGAPIRRAVSLPGQISINDTNFRSWLNMATHIYKQLESSPALIHDSLMLSQFQQVLMNMLFSLGTTREEHLSLEQSRQVLPAHVRRAADFMRANFEQDITIEQLTRLTGVSSRSLYDGFSRFLGLSPMQYLKDLRLECFRRDLLDPAQPRNVTALATRLGFYQLGRLSGEYRARYGETPIQTIKRADN